MGRARGARARAARSRRAPRRRRARSPPSARSGGCATPRRRWATPAAVTPIQRIATNPADRKPIAGAEAQHRAAGDRPPQGEGKPVERGGDAEHESQFRRQLVRAFPQPDRTDEQQHRQPAVRRGRRARSRSRRAAAASSASEQRRGDARRVVQRQQGRQAPCPCRPPPGRRAAGCRRRARRQDTGRAHRRARIISRTTPNVVASCGLPRIVADRPQQHPRRAEHDEAELLQRADSAPSGRGRWPRQLRRRRARAWA